MQGSHASWKVLYFFLKIPEPVKAWKNILESRAFLVVQVENIEIMCKYVHLNSEQLTEIHILLHAVFSAMNYSLSIVSKCRLSLYLNVCGLRIGPEKYLMWVLEKSWIFCQ